MLQIKMQRKKLRSTKQILFEIISMQSLRSFGLLYNFSLFISIKINYKYKTIFVQACLPVENGLGLRV